MAARRVRTLVPDQGRPRIPLPAAGGRGATAPTRNPGPRSDPSSAFPPLVRLAHLHRRGPAPRLLEALEERRFHLAL